MKLSSEQIIEIENVFFFSLVFSEKITNIL